MKQPVAPVANQTKFTLSFSPHLRISQPPLKLMEISAGRGASPGCERRTDQLITACLGRLGLSFDSLSVTLTNLTCPPSFLLLVIQLLGHVIESLPGTHLAIQRASLINNPHCLSLHLSTYLIESSNCLLKLSSYGWSMYAYMLPYCKQARSPLGYCGYCF
jgi:hypothetical protein